MTTLDDLRAMPPGADRVRAINAWIDDLGKQIVEAQRIRNEDVKAVYLEERKRGVHGANGRVARALDMSVSSVRGIVGPVSALPDAEGIPTNA